MTKHPLRRLVKATYGHGCSIEDRDVQPSEIARIQLYLRRLFRLDTIEIVRRPKKDDSVEVMVAGEFIGVIFKDDEDGETSYQFQMCILDEDLPAPR